MIRDLECPPETLAGPLDPRVITDFKKRYLLDPVYLEYMATNHGGQPKVNRFKAGKHTRELALFLTLYDHRSKLTKPKRPHFEDSREDERWINSIDYLKNGEHNTSRALFGGLLPFAATQADMQLDHAYVDLLCFDYRKKEQKRIPVVLWQADDANGAYMDWDELDFGEQFADDESFLNVPWDDFLVPVAPDFSAFVKTLKRAT